MIAGRGAVSRTEIAVLAGLVMIGLALRLVPWLRDPTIAFVTTRVSLATGE